MKISKFILSFFLLCMGYASATNYYVSTTGSDSSNGTLANPFKTLSKAAGMAASGDTIFIGEGTYSEHNITPKSSGTERSMIVFKPYPNTANVILKHPGTSISDNTPVFQLSNRNYIRIEGLTFKDFSYGKASIFISNGKGNIVTNNTFENLGNAEVGTWDGNQVVALFNSTHNVVSHNTFENIIGDGINVNSQQTSYNLISNNSFLNFQGKLRGWGGTYLFSRAIDIQDMSNGNNVFVLNKATNVINHLWLDRDGSGNIILRNLGRDGGGTVFNESRCANNVIQENISINMETGFMSAYYDNTGWTIRPRWINNVAYNNKLGFNIHKSEEDEFRNNIAFNNTQYNLAFTQEAYSNEPHTFRNNLWYSTNRVNSILFRGTAHPVADFQYAVKESNGLSVNPLFSSLTTGSEDFTLQSNSPAKGAADNGLDLGAYALYPPQPFGKTTSLAPYDYHVYFDQVLSTVNRGDSVQVTIRLNRAAPVEITTAITPIAGDGEINQDVILSADELRFQPGETSKTLIIKSIGTARYDELLALRVVPLEHASPGARDIHILRLKRSLLPIAYAGYNQTFWDNHNDGVETISLDASKSSTPNTSIQTYEWLQNDQLLSNEATAALDLPVGTHTLQLRVTDNLGYSDTDYVAIQIIESNGVWLEAEYGTVGSLWETLQDENASNTTYVSVLSGNNSNNSAPTDASGWLQYTFDIKESGTYNLFTRVICPTSNDDSFWFKMNNETFYSWNGIGNNSSWTWYQLPKSYNLAAGIHRLTIGFREDGAKLDKLWITKSATAPLDSGALADNLPTSTAAASMTPHIVLHSNPVGNILSLTAPEGLKTVRLLDLSGKLQMQQQTVQNQINIDVTAIQSGMYVLQVIEQNQTTQYKIIKK